MAETEDRSPLVPDPTIKGTSASHVNALDGLRGVAVLLVVAFHCLLRAGWTLQNSDPVATGALAGWLGVDIFFVLSGYLITGILLDTRETPNFLRNFYVRRVLRIMPVYFLLLTIVLLILPRFVDYSDPSQQLVLDRQGWLWTHMSNVSFVYYGKAWLLAGWLDLSHLWSLAVEEQFYLVWPFIILWCRPRWLPAICIAGIVVPILFRFGLWGAGQSAGAMYFATPCRVDGLSLGALVAVAFRTASAERRRQAIRILATLGIAGFAGLVSSRGGLWFSDKLTIALAPTFTNFLAAATIISILQGGTASTRLLENRFLRFTGRYSYGLYLFHPLITGTLALVLLPAGTGPTYAGTLLFIAAVCLLSFLAAIVSFHGFERPFLRLKTRFHAR